MKKRILLILITFSTLAVSCFDDLDDNIQNSSKLKILHFKKKQISYYRGTSKQKDRLKDRRSQSYDRDLNFDEDRDRDRDRIFRD